MAKKHERYASIAERSRLSYKPLPYEKRAGIVIDMQPTCTETLDGKRLESLVCAQIETISYLAGKGCPIILVELNQEMYMQEPKEKERMTKTLPPITDAAQKASYSTTVRKDDLNGFGGTELETILISLGSEQLYLMGLFTSCCVRATAMGATARGFGIATAEDLTADPRQVFPFFTEEKLKRQTKQTIKWLQKNGLYRQRHNEIL
ncbi:MAG: isochorismatase family protein [Candidatus Aenigmatarchaeota archaeon]